MKNLKTEKYNKLWEKYNRKVCYFISQIISRENPDFDDIFQEIMMIIYKNMETIEGFSSPLSWIYRTSRNYCIDYIKLKKDYDSQDDMNIIIDNSSGPEELLLKNEINDHIGNLILELPENDRLISYLHFYEDMKYREIAVVMDININTIKTRMRFIKKFLRINLEGAI